MRISDWSSDVCSSDLRPLHQILFFLLCLEHKCADRIDDHLEEGDLDGAQQNRRPQEQRQQCKPRNRHMNRENETYRLSNIVIDPPPSRIAETIAPKSSSTSTIAHHSRTTLVPPLPMATPISAASTD